MISLLDLRTNQNAPSKYLEWWLYLIPAANRLSATNKRYRQQKAQTVMSTLCTVLCTKFGYWASQPFGKTIRFVRLNKRENMQQTVVKTYKGSQEQATSEYKEDAERMAKRGYTSSSQVWTAGSYGGGSFVIALLLCFILIGILVFIYMLIVKPAGTLTVTYVLAPRTKLERVCPKCAEHVKAAAAVCRFCGHTFETAFTSPITIAATPSRAEVFGRKLGSFYAQMWRK